MCRGRTIIKDNFKIKAREIIFFYVKKKFHQFLKEMLFIKNVFSIDM